MKERCEELYSTFIPSCSVIQSGRREGKRLYITLDCKYHGLYELRGDDLKHRGCKNCTFELKRTLYREQWVKDCTEIHNNRYDYSDTIVGDVLTVSNIKCRVCSLVFPQTPASHKSGKGCPKCMKDEAGLRRRKGIEFVIEKAKEVGFNYDFSKSVYLTCKDEIEIVCDKGHTFFLTPDVLLNKPQGCNFCVPAGTSAQEQSLLAFISRYFKCKGNDRKILGGKELDIYIPSIKVGIEYNGLYWHSNEKIKTSHFEKLNLSANKNTHIIMVYENDWLFRNQAVKNKLLDNLKVKEPNYTDVFFADLDVGTTNHSKVVEMYEKASLEKGFKKEGYYVMKMLDEIVGIAPYVNTKTGRIIGEMVRPLGATQTDYLRNFITYFRETGKDIKILVSLDWLEDLALINLKCDFESLVKERKHYIVKGELQKEPIKENNTYIIKAGHAIYKINN